MKDKVVQFWIEGNLMYLLYESGALYYKPLNGPKMTKVKLPTIFKQKQ